TCWCHNERLWCTWCRQLVVAFIIWTDCVLKHGQSESQRFSGTGFRLSNDVLTIKCDRQGHGLDGKRLLNALIGQCINDVGAQLKICKRFLESICHYRVIRSEERR